MTNLELFMFSNRNKGGGGTSPVPPEPSPPDVPYSDWVTLAELPNGTTALPDDCFNGFSNLRNVVINDGLTTIGTRAFYDCTSLKEIEIPRTVTTIGEQALGYGESGKISDFTIKCDYETAAEEYAITNNIPFIYINGTFNYEIMSDNKVLIISYNGTSDTVYVPANIDGYPVRRARHSAFSNINIKYLIIKHGFAGFVNNGVHDWGGLSTALIYLYLPNTYVAEEHPGYILQPCTNLQEIELENGFNYPLVCNNCPLTQQSLVGMLNALADLTGEQAKTLTLGSTNLAKLTNEQKAIATQKNWTLA